jgi:cbb3-type cytochrome oxidase maturation protein
MTNLVYLIAAALLLGLLGLAAFLWALRSGQFDDLEGAAHRILFDEEDLSERRLSKRPARPAGTGEEGAADGEEEAPGRGRGKD